MMKSTTTFKTVEVKFRLDEEFDEVTADDRQAKVESRNLGRLLKTAGFTVYYLNKPLVSDCYETGGW